MTFWELFFRLLLRRPWDALSALYWRITRRRVRAFNRLRTGTANLPFAYRFWIRTIERNRQRENDFKLIAARWRWQPRFAILIHCRRGCTDDRLRRSITSIERQLYAAWTVIESLNDPGCGEYDFVVPVRAGDSLSKVALFRFAEAIQADSHATVLYGDQDELDPRGRRRRPWFKPGWNPEMFLAQDFLSAAVAIKRSVILEFVGRDAPDLHTLLLSATSTDNGAVVHVPHILCHVNPQPDEELSGARVEAVTRHVQSLGASTVAGLFGTIKVQWPLPAEPPLVSIIIPTRDALEVLRPCIESVLRLTTYERFEIVVVDNGSTDAATLAYFEDLASEPTIRILRYDAPYNYSAINNWAAEMATGSYLCLLNNDTEVLEPDWLTEMMRYAVRSDVGAVGAKLLYADGTIQHAGVVIGMGEGAGHAHRFQPSGEAGYFGQPHVAQFVSAVTAACLVVAKTKFQAVGGLDAQNLAIAYNDVDHCLKLQAAGWRNVYVPHAVLLHHESKSRGSDVSPEHVERYTRELRVLQERWGTKSYQDPLHNPNLDRYSETFLLRL